MRKFIKISGKVLSWIIITIFCLPLIAALLLNVEGIQNFAVHKATSILSQKLGTQVHIDHIRLRSFSKLTAEGFYIADLQGDTMLYAGRLGANISKIALLNNRIVIGNVFYDKGKIYLHTPEGSDINIAAVIAKLGSDKAPNDNPSPIIIRNIHISDSRFMFRTDGKTPPEQGMNFADMMFNGLNINTDELTIKGGELTFDGLSMSFVDHCGFTVKQLSTGTLQIGDGLIAMDNTRIITADSELHMPHLRLNGDNWTAFSDFVNNVRLEVILKKSTVSTGTLFYFIPSLFHGHPFTMENVNVDFAGPVNDFTTTLQFMSGNDTNVEIQAGITDITDFANSEFKVNVKKFLSSGQTLERMANAVLKDSLPKTARDILTHVDSLSLSANVDGSMENMMATVFLATNAGNIAVRGTCGLSQDNVTEFNGSMTINGLDAGWLTGNEKLGKFIANARAEGRIDNGVMDIDGHLFVPLMDFNGQHYTQISASGTYANNKANVNIISGDPKLAFSAKGSVDMNSEIPSYTLSANLRRANMYSLGINHKDSVSLASGQLQAAVSGSKLDNINGEARLLSLSYKSSTDNVQADSILLTARNSEDEKYMSMTSPVADIEFTSDRSYQEIFDYLGKIIYAYLPALDASGNKQPQHLQPTPEYDAAPDTYGHSELHINVKEANNIAAIFVPGFSIAEGTKADITFNPINGTFAVNADSDYIEYSGFFATRLCLLADNTSIPNAINMSFMTEDLYTPKFSLPSNSISIQASTDTVMLSAMLSNSSSKLNALLNAKTVLSRNADNVLCIQFNIDSASHVTTGPQTWNLSSDTIKYSPEGLSIRHFSITNQEQLLKIDGMIGKSPSDTLRLTLNDFSISPINTILKLPGKTIDGRLNGKAELISGMHEPVMIADIMMNRLSMYEYTAPSLRLVSAWDFANERAGLSLINMTDGKSLIRGFYRPNTGSYIATIDISDMQLAAINPFLPKDVIHSVVGNMSLYMDIRSDEKGPQFNGTVSVSDLATTIGITNVTYTTPLLDIDINGDKVTIPQTILTDNEGNNASLEAYADISNFGNIRYSAKLVPDNIMAINTTAKDNQKFYGKVYVSGGINAHGSKQGIVVDVAINTRPNSALYIPLSDKSNISTAEWIVFESGSNIDNRPTSVLEQKKQQYEQALKEHTKFKEQTDMTLNVSLNINPGLLLSIIIDPNSDMALNARGSASLDVLLNPNTGDTSIFGTYEIAEGDFLFNLQPIINNKKFSLQSGGTIQFNGSPLDALLNIEAIYKLRASLQPLASSLEGTGINTNTRIPVECIANISESLKQPNLSFNIRIPSADTDIQNVLSGALASNEDRALNFMFLVGLGSFAPNSNTDAENDASSAGASLGLNFLTSQVTNLISNDNLNINLNYRPQDKTSSDEVDFGFSYNIGGNNRLILEVEGNYNADNSMRANNSSLSGDASITWAVTPTGNILLKGFTRTINRYDENQGLQENGVGVYYREDFNVFSDIIQQSKARKAARKRKHEEKMAQKEADAAQGSTIADEAVEPVEQPMSRIERRRANAAERRRRISEEMSRRNERDNDAAGTATQPQDKM